MLDSLTARLTGIFDRLRGFGRLTEENVQEALREVRVALLEADVNFKVVKSFVERVRVKAIGQDVLTSLTPGQHVVKVVHDELVELLGGSGHRLAMASHPPTVIMLVGLQGSGKTTSAAKLARHFQKQGQHPILASADVYRPAAMEQLRRLGKDLGIPVLGEEKQRPVEICRARATKRPSAASLRSFSTRRAGYTSTKRCSRSSAASRRTPRPITCSSWWTP
jgi:Signal recognition particle GTPase